MPTSGTTSLRSIASACAASISQTFPGHIPLYLVALAFSAATLVIAALYHVPLPFGASAFFLEMVGLFFVLTAAMATSVQFVSYLAQRRRQPFSALMGQCASEYVLCGERPGNMFHSLVILTPLMICFTALKDVIPRLNPFSWDKIFAAWGRYIAFGHQSWEILQPIVGYPPVTSAISVVYELWLGVVFCCLFWQAFAKRQGPLRTQFLLAFTFNWFICGNLLAVIFSSAGPCFYGQLNHGANPYAGLMAYLQAANQHWPVLSLRIQQQLWHSYISGDGVVTGISAMPSMHVISSMTMTLLAWRTSKALGWAFTLFTAIIIVGSIHLGWHYAADGIAGIILAVVFWWLAGEFARAWARRQPRSSSNDGEMALAGSRSAGTAAQAL
jgi:hypothetical protein